jgi:hypothetical protein
MEKNDENKAELNDFINNFKGIERFVEKDYVLFLFQSYNFHDGVEWFCNKLGFR